MKKLILTALLAFSLIPAVANAEVYVKLPPPPPIVEHPGPPPHPGNVWIAGYYRWDGEHYVWVRGHYDSPPSPHDVWVAHSWEHTSRGWVLVQGHWR